MTGERGLEYLDFEFRFLSSASFRFYAVRTAIEPFFLVVLETGNVLANTLEESNLWTFFTHHFMLISNLMSSIEN